MARIYPAASYLLRRGASWYFRLHLPSEIQSAVGAPELRLSLFIGDLAIARVRVGELLRYVILLKRLNQHMAELTPEIAQTVLSQAYARVVDALRLSQAPWRQPEPPADLPTEMRSRSINIDFEAADSDSERRRLVKFELTPSRYGSAFQSTPMARA